MLTQTRQRTEGVAKAAFDGAYGWKPNFAVAEAQGIDLYVREKQGEDRTGPTWPKMARDPALLERMKLAEYDEVQALPKQCGEPAVAHQGAQSVHPPGAPQGRPAFGISGRRGPEREFEQILPYEVQDAILDTARQDVGGACLNESLAILIVANLRTLNAMEHLYDQRVEFPQGQSGHV